MEIHIYVICGRLYRGRRNKQWINKHDIVIINYELNKRPDKDGNYSGEVCHKYSTSDIFKLENSGELNQEVFNLESVKNEDLGFDWDYDEQPTEEELKELKREKALASNTYFNYDNAFSSDEEESSEKIVNSPINSDDNSNDSIDINDI